MHKRVHVYYAGRVQGVGFRFTVERKAVDLGIVGWVKNLSDGKVELLAEAEEKDLSMFLTTIDKTFSEYIQKKTLNWSPSMGEFNFFEIRFF